MRSAARCGICRGPSELAAGPARHDRARGELVDVDTRPCFGSERGTYVEVTVPLDP